MNEPAITVRHLDTEEDREAALATMLSAMGWRVEVVGGEEFLIPTDTDHPAYASSLRRIQRALRHNARDGSDTNPSPQRGQE